MILFIDFDYTLYDSKRGSSYLISKVSIKADPNKELKKVFAELVMKGKLVVEKGELAPYLYPDVIRFLENHSDDQLVLITHGNEVWQSEKVKGTDIGRYFSDLLFTGSEMKGPVIKRFMRERETNSPAVFIDDDPYQLASVIDYCPDIVSVRVLREEVYKDSWGDPKGLKYSVNNFTEFDELLKKL